MGRPGQSTALAQALVLSKALASGLRLEALASEREEAAMFTGQCLRGIRDQICTVQDQEDALLEGVGAVAGGAADGAHVVAEDGAGDRHAVTGLQVVRAGEDTFKVYCCRH